MDIRKEVSPDLNMKVPESEFSKLKIHGNRKILSKSQFDISVGIGSGAEKMTRLSDFAFLLRTSVPN